jgi:YrbI family 3-deoxy-D-manno-octulosonate 8-phosphate phosphatase
MSTKRVLKKLVIIPARGGSKGIPQKNIRFLAGKPLIAHVIEQAQQAQMVDRVVVSTDDPGIGAVAEQYGVEVVWRPKEISGDEASSELALLHALDELQRTEAYEPDLVAFLQCTSPLTLAEDIDGTVKRLLDTGADNALAVTPFHYFLWQEDESAAAIGINHDKQTRLLRQERESQFLETGAVYVMRVRGFKAAKHRFFGKTVMYVMPRERSLEIDEPMDFLIAEALMREHQGLRKLVLLPDTIDGVALDFDGVFTDNRVIVFQDEQEAVVCNRSDGWGLAHLNHLKIPVIVISSEENPVVGARCRKLHIPYMQGVQDKLNALQAWAHQEQIDLSRVVYLGNDVNDLACLEGVGCGMTVNDAHPQAKAVARIVLDSKGGYGAIGELVGLIEKKLKER